MYTYYKEVVRDEHLLFVEEIQDYLLAKYGKLILVRSIHSFYRNYAKEHNEYEQLYYKTRNGLKKVYPVDIILEELILQ